MDFFFAQGELIQVDIRHIIRLASYSHLCLKKFKRQNVIIELSVRVVALGISHYNESQQFWFHIFRIKDETKTYAMFVFAPTLLIRNYTSSCFAYIPHSFTPK